MTDAGTVKVRTFAPMESFRGIGGDLFTRTGCWLGKKTVIFGRNGTGKTTFAEVLRTIDGTDENSGRSAVLASYAEGNRWRTGPLPESVVRRIHVFNRYFVEEELAFFLDGRAASAGILKLGARNVHAEKALRSVQDSLVRDNRWLETVRATRGTLARDEKAAKEDAKRRVLEVLGTVREQTYNSRVFTVATVKKLLLESQPEVALDEVRYGQHMDLLRRQDAPRRVPAIAAPPLDLLDLGSRVGEAVSRKLSSVVRSALENDRVLSEWIQAGLDLHQAGDLCRFCESGRLSEELRTAYSSHFDTSSAQLRDDLESLARQIGEAQGALQSWWEELPEADDLLPAYQVRWKDVLATLDAVRRSSADHLDTVAAVVSQRAENLYEEVAPRDAAAPDAADLSEAGEVLAANNADVERMSEVRQQAESEILHHLVDSFRKRYLTAVRRQELATRVQSSLERQIRSLRQEERRWQDDQQEVGQMADLINQDLADHLGHVHLTLTVSEDGQGYRVLRGEKLAVNLSEGERSSIALLYFLRSLEADDVTPATDLVVIDDPVTSLDKDGLFAAFSLVTERTKSFAQMIVLTHDFDLFRLLLVNCEKARAASVRAIRSGDTKEKEFPQVQFLETKAHMTASGDREISLHPMSPRLLEHPTEYHYIFHRIAEAVSTQVDADLPLLGNAARRLLEGFVAFKAPSGGDFRSKVERAASMGEVPNELTQRMIRFVHGASHRDEPNPSVTLGSAMVSEELGQVLRFVYSCDHDHFTGMCKAVDVDLKPQVARWKKAAGLQRSKPVPKPPAAQSPNPLPFDQPEN
ncbi:AAA family ATPase [Kribbella sp. NPDC051770]|uniref:AAA family ATPase n=1 Tax=Kribbella sp. NPDC051770 TaxID=3155413 RepID=UPI00343B7AEA